MKCWHLSVWRSRICRRGCELSRTVTEAAINSLWTPKLAVGCVASPRWSCSCYLRRYGQSRRWCGPCPESRWLCLLPIPDSKVSRTQVFKLHGPSPTLTNTVTGYSTVIAVHGTIIGFQKSCLQCGARQEHHSQLASGGSRRRIWVQSAVGPPVPWQGPRPPRV